MGRRIDLERLPDLAMEELKRVRVEKAIAWSGYFIAFIGITVLLIWVWVRP
jgi:hypothetical protein